MKTKLPARQQAAVSLFEENRFTAEEIAELERLLGENNLRYIRDQNANLGFLAMSMNNIQREIVTQKVALARTTPAQELKTLREDERAVKEKAQLIMQKQLGVLESALKSVRKNSPMYKKILGLIEPTQRLLEGGQQS